MIRQNCKFAFIVLTVLTACLVLSGSDASAQPPRDRDGRGERRERADSDGRNRPPRNGRPGPPRGPGDERSRNRGDRGRRSSEPIPESEVLTFIDKNHPELLKSIDWLKKERPTQYDNALRGISGQLRRLKAIKKHSNDRYELELKLWQVDSKIRLLAGQQTLKPSDEQKAELLELIAEDMKLRPQVEMERINAQLDSLKERQQKIEKRIANGMDDSKVSQRLEEILERTQRRMESVRGSRSGRRGHPKKDVKPERKPETGE